MNRKDFIKTSTLSMLALSAFGLNPGCSNISRDSITPCEQHSPVLNILGKEKSDIFHYASLAPSSHNIQPWKVRIIDNSNFEITIDTSRILRAVDPAMREIYISMGTFLENLLQASESYGYKCSYSIKTEGDFFISLKMEKSNDSSKINNENLERIALRRTLRKNYLSKPVPESIIRDLFAEDYDNILYFPQQSMQSRLIADATFSANRIQVNNSASQKELSEWIRWSNSDAKEHMDGLTPATMEIDGLSGFFVRSFYDKENVMSEGFKKQTLGLVKEQLDQFGNWIIITTKDNSEASLINAGMIYERAMLRIRERNIAFHPMSQAIEEKEIYQSLKKSLNIDGCIQFIIRAGYVEEYQKPVSLRRPVEAFIVIE
ncbi:MAG: nitroreductase [Bacteroidota bacterium]|nr:nitroreductase [Bacteroidota bacterium]MDP4197810.1 nitroreductase [Bacteroidota bacterium]